MATLKFYMTPGSCSTGIHILLEEVGLAFEAHLVNLLAGDHRKPEYLAINPRGTVPALALTDGVVLGEFQDIARWLADNDPRRKLTPASPEDQRRVRQVMDYAISVVHGEGFTRVFVSEGYATGDRTKKQIEAEGRQIAMRGFERLESMIRGPGFVVESFSIADAALFYVEFWADHLGLTLPPKCLQHFQKMLLRPAVRQVLAEEGYAQTLLRHTGSIRPLLSRRAASPG